MKKTLSIILTILMIVTSVPFAFAAETDEALWGTADNLAFSGTLTEAFLAAQNNSEITYIKLNSDIILTEGLWIHGGFFTLDINGKTLSLDIDEEDIWATPISVSGGATVVFDDTAVEKGEIISDGVGVNVAWGKGVFKNIVITGKSYGIVVISDGTSEIDGAEITGTDYAGVKPDGAVMMKSGTASGAYAVMLTEDCSVFTMTGGNLEGNSGDIKYGNGTIDLSGNNNSEGITLFNDYSYGALNASSISLPYDYHFYDADGNYSDILEYDTTYTIRVHKCSSGQLCMGYFCEVCSQWCDAIDANMHDWSNLDGVCANGCGTTCAHENMNSGICGTCGYFCHHENMTDSKCDDCGLEGKIVTITMTDSYGDGWNGNAIKIEQFIDGTYTEVATATIEDGTSGTFTIALPEEGIYAFKWVKGNYSEECSFTVAVNGENVYEATDCSEFADGQLIYVNCEHKNYTNGKCDVCGTDCPHEDITDGTCGNCGFVCLHEDYINGICDICGYICPHESYTDSVCDVCGTDCPHEDISDGKCNDCGTEGKFVTITMTDSYGDGWNGNAIAIEQLIDGEYTDVATATIEDGNSGTFIIALPEEGVYAFKWVKGDYSEECSFTVAVNGETVCESTDSSEFEDGQVVYVDCDHSIEGNICTKCNLECGVDFEHEITGDTCTVCGKYMYAITHQPTEAEPYVELNDGTDASYQWHSVKEAELELTDESSITSGGSYSAEKGWTVPEPSGGYDTYLTVSLKYGETIRLVFDQYVTSVFILPEWAGIGSEFREDINGTEYSFTAYEDSVYTILLYEANAVRAYMNTVVYTKLEGETAAELANPVVGTQYVCEVTFADGTTEMSEAFEVTKLHDCDFSGEWEYDSEKHWKECVVDGCGKISEEAEHSFTESKCACGYTCPHENYTDGVCDNCEYACPHDWTDYGYCPKCKTSCKHENNENGVCTVCDYVLAFSVITGDVVSYYDDLDYALVNAENGSTVKLMKYLHKIASYEINKSITFDLNGNGWETGSSDYIDVNAFVTFTDSVGTGRLDLSLNLYSPCVFNGGTYKSIGICFETEDTLDDYLADCYGFFDHYTGEFKDVSDEKFVMGVKVDINHNLGVQTCKGYQCGDCGNYFGEADPDAHDWSNLDGVCVICSEECSHEWGEGVLTRPTLVDNDGFRVWEEGYYTYTCTICGDEKTKAVESAETTLCDELLMKVLSYDLDETLTQEARDEIYQSYRDFTNNNSEILDQFGFIRGDLIADEQPIIDEAVAELREIIADIEEKIVSGEYVNADYTGIDEAIKAIDEALEKVTVSEEMKAELEAIKADLEALKADANTSVADLANSGLLDRAEAITETMNNCANGVHEFGEYTSNGDATCTADGTKTAECANGCGETDTVVDEGTMLDHTDEDGDKLCDDCGGEAYEHCGLCGGKAHGEDRIGWLFCLITTLVRLITSLLTTVA